MKDDSKGYSWNPPNYRYCNFQGKTLHVNVFGDNTDTAHFHPCIGKTPMFSDFAYQINMTIEKGDCGGVIFRIDWAYDTSYNIGKIGVLAKAFDTFRPTEVAFSDATVWKL